MHRLVIALVTLIGLTGATFIVGYLLLFSAATDRAAAMAPANSSFYLNVYLQPSTGQQMNLGGLIGRLPGFADDASLDEKVDQVVQNLLGGTGVDYREQIKPWLGDQVALAGWPSTADALTPDLVVIAEVKDPVAAEAALADLVGAGGASFTSETYEGIELHVGEGNAYGFVGEMLVAGPTVEGLEAVVDAHGDAASLADRDDFRSTMAGLPSDHLASIFIDLAGMADATDLTDQVAGVSTAGAALVAERDGLRLSGSAPFDAEHAAASARAGFALGGEPSSLVHWMPDETVAEVVVFGLRNVIEDMAAAAGSTPEGEQLTGALDTIRALAAFGFGIDLDADVMPLLEREVGIALTGIEDGRPSGQILLRPEDPSAASDALARIAERLVSTGVDERTETVEGTEVTVLALPEIGDVAFAVSDEIVILGLGFEDVAAAIEAHAGGGSLGGGEPYAHTFEIAGERAGNEAYVDVGAVVELMGDAIALPDDARDILSAIGTFGFSAPSRDDEIEFHAVLTVEEP